MAIKTNKKWYQKDVSIILLLLLFFPAGLYLMWKYASWKTRTKWFISGFYSLVILFNIVFPDKSDNASVNTTQVSSQNKQDNNQVPSVTPKPSEIELDAEVRYNSVAFQITNKTDVDWNGCRLVLNGRLFAEDFSYNAGTIAGKEEIVIPFSEFTKGDGTRFNSIEKKAQNLSISCDVGGVRGFNYFGIQ